MSSDDDALPNGIEYKKRKLQRACDRCKQRKIRCGDLNGKESKCYNCSCDEAVCTWNEAEKSRRRKYTKSYVEGIEARLKRAEALLAELHPGVDFSKELDGTIIRGELQVNVGIGARTTNTDIALDMDSSDEDTQVNRLSEQVEKLKIHGSHPHFVGKSSGVRLVLDAFRTKRETSYNSSMLERAKRIMSLRPQFWTIAPWEAQDVSHCKVEVSINYHFPQPDVITALVNSYFSNSNRFLPLLHRPTFDSQVLSALHLRDPSFASVLLLVCSIGAQWLNDPRYWLEGETSPASAGWRWFSQVQTTRKSLWATPQLEDIQTSALAMIFLSGSSSPQVCWTIAGVGLRIAQEVGAHRRKAYSTLSKHDEELWKRAFWVLLTSDRILSYTLGYSVALYDEDFDVEEPIDCDDEYWDAPNPEEAFKQPRGKPSTITSFLLLIRLHRILAMTMRTLYSVNRSTSGMHTNSQELRQHAVADLDSELNKWIDSVPNHLRWDPARETIDHFDQSALIYCHYYLVQIFVHRRFIPTYGRHTSQSFTSQAVCTTAARACSHLLYIQQARTGRPLPYQIIPALTAGVILLLSIWGARRSALKLNFRKEMEDVRMCMEVLKKCENQWPSAGRCWDILSELTSANELPLPAQVDIPSLKRCRDDASVPVSSFKQRYPQASPNSNEPQNFRPDPDGPSNHASWKQPQIHPVEAVGYPSNHGTHYAEVDTTNNWFSNAQPSSTSFTQALAPSLIGSLVDGSCPVSDPAMTMVDSVNLANAGDPTLPLGTHSYEPFGSLLQSFADEDESGMWWSPSSALGGDNWDSFLNSLQDLEGQALEAQKYP